MYSKDIESWAYWDRHMKKDTLEWGKWINTNKRSRNLTVIDFLIHPKDLDPGIREKVFNLTRGIWSAEDLPDSWLKIAFLHVKISFLCSIKMSSNKLKFMGTKGKKNKP